HRDRVEGTGLGLAISKQLVQKMGGDIKVKSTLGQGSVFWFELELPRICQLAEVTNISKQRIIGFQGNKLKVLVIDDKWSNRSVIVNMLEPLGFEVLEAIDGLDGLTKAQAFQPDCVILDLVMPGMDGFEVTRRLRTLPELAGVVAIAISASVFDFDRQQSQAVGCDDFLPKPVRETDLLEKLRIHLGLQWIYEEESTEKALDNSSASELATGAIVPPPAEEMVKLLDLAMRGDIRGIIEQAVRIEALDRRYRPFALHLRQLAKSYKEKQILEFVKKYLDI
ncbi:response regulator, partial [Chroococcidiopsidales cyanobacterium LEGE 13417]|nr:response regulator [Chroococcidiopsidales cyanobacterium LEGE 13417]